VNGYKVKTLQASTGINKFKPAQHLWFQ